MIDGRPLYSLQTFPPYSYVPGFAPHPVSDPTGHMYGQTHASSESLRPDAWQASNEYRFGIDLFNHGFYWEAHEAWESLWHAAGRSGPIADFLKGLIKLAAAGVKAREGNPRGVRRHVERAVELLGGVTLAEYCGLNLREVIDLVTELGRNAESYNQAGPEIVLDAVLVLRSI